MQDTKFSTFFGDLRIYIVQYFSCVYIILEHHLYVLPFYRPTFQVISLRFSTMEPNPWIIFMGLSLVMKFNAQTYSKKLMSLCHINVLSCNMVANLICNYKLIIRTRPIITSFWYPLIPSGIA
jgi:hypothetical protein